MFRSIFFGSILLSAMFLSSCFVNSNSGSMTWEQAPFENLDTIAINDWWNRADNPIIDVRVPREEVIAFGLYTVHNKVLKLSAQLFPLYPKESRDVRLEIRKGDKWKEVQVQKVNEIGWSALFRIEDWDDTKDVSYRLRHGKKAVFKGLIRRDPKDKEEIIVAALSCKVIRIEEIEQTIFEISIIRIQTSSSLQVINPMITRSIQQHG